MHADLHSKFREQHKEYSPEPRSFYGYVTCVVVRRRACICVVSKADCLGLAGYEGDGVDSLVGCVFRLLSPRLFLLTHIPQYETVSCSSIYKKRTSSHEQPRPPLPQ